MRDPQTGRLVESRFRTGEHEKFSSKGIYRDPVSRRNTGDIISAPTGKPFYITSSRYRSMVTDYVTPMDKTNADLDQPKISLDQGVQETAAWLRIRYKPSLNPRPTPPSGSLLDNWQIVRHFTQNCFEPRRA